MDLRQLYSSQFGSFPLAERQTQRDLLFLGRAVSQLREQQGSSTEALATSTGVEQTRIQALEAGRLNPGYDLLILLAEGLGIRPSAFFIRAEEIQAEEHASKALDHSDSAIPCPSRRLGEE
jgi:transcriptional regulator with XRE-family HTH domain